MCTATECGALDILNLRTGKIRTVATDARYGTILECTGTYGFNRRREHQVRSKIDTAIKCTVTNSGKFASGFKTDGTDPCASAECGG